MRTDDGLTGLDGDPEVAVDDPVVTATGERGEELRHALIADEHRQAVAIHLGVAEAHPAAVLDRDGLVQAPGLLELLLVRLRDPRVVGEAGGRPTGGREEDGVDHDRDPDEDRDRLEHASDDVLGHGSLQVGVWGRPRDVGVAGPADDTARRREAASPPPTNVRGAQAGRPERSQADGERSDRPPSHPATTRRRTSAGRSTWGPSRSGCR